MNSKPPTPATGKNRHHHERLEAIRPFVKKYQYYQLPLPEPLPTQEIIVPENKAEFPQAKNVNQE